jgi:hypothetical protein
MWGVAGSIGLGLLLAGSITVAADLGSHRAVAGPDAAVLEPVLEPADAFPVAIEDEDARSDEDDRFDRFSRRSRRIIPPAPQRAPGEPPRIAIQAGHWLAREVPEELNGLRYNGTEAAGHVEWRVTLAIAQLAADLLTQQGYVVEVLPTTIPPLYYADAFVSVHADGHDDPTVSGFTVASPRRDVSGRAEEFREIMGQTYNDATKLRRRTYITRRMTGYYAFNSRRYQHALHPETPAIILETGFITSPDDRRIIVDAQALPARGIVDAVMRFIPVETAAVATATP